MRLMLPTDGLARLEEATRTLLSPLAAPDVDTWRQEAMRATCAALGAESGSFTFPGRSKVVVLFGLDERLAGMIDHFTGATWSGTGTSPEPLLDEFYRLIVQRRLEVWDMHSADHILGGKGTAWNNLFHNEVLAPYGLSDTNALFVPSPCGSAMLTLHHFRRKAEPGQYLPVLRVLLPAFKAGLDAIALLDAHRATLDVLPVPLAVFTMDGQEVFRNPALGCLLVSDSEAERVRAAMSHLVASLCTLGFGRPAGGAPTLDPADRTVKTRKTTYHLRGTLLASSVFSQDGAVMLSVTAGATPSLPDAEILRERFGLTRREAEVALLLAEGLSNRALAERLFISPHTARHHTEQVFGKLGLKARSALAHTLLQPG